MGHDHFLCHKWYGLCHILGTAETPAFKHILFLHSFFGLANSRTVVLKLFQENFLQPLLRSLSPLCLREATGITPRFLVWCLLSPLNQTFHSWSLRVCTRIRFRLSWAWGNLNGWAWKCSQGLNCLKMAHQAGLTWYNECLHMVTAQPQVSESPDICQNPRAMVF